MLCRQHVYDALDAGSREFDLGHTWDGAPLSSRRRARRLDLLVERGLVDRVRERGPALRDELAAAVGGSPIVREVRGRGFLLGVELVDPRDGKSFLPDELDAADLVDQTAIEHGLLVTSTHSTPDGYAGDQTLLAPAYTSSDEELAEMVERFARRWPSRTVKAPVVGRGDPMSGDEPGSVATARPEGHPTALGRREFVLLGIPDVNGSLRGKALRPRGLRVGRRARNGDDRPPARARPGGHADHRLRAVRHPLRAPPT